MGQSSGYRAHIIPCGSGSRVIFGHASLQSPCQCALPEVIREVLAPFLQL